MKTEVALVWVVWVLVCTSLLSSAQAAQNYFNRQSYYGNGVGGAVGNATLTMSNNNYTVYGKFDKGVGTFADNLVIYIDCAPGGFTSTSPFSDHGSPLETAVSGYSGSKRSTATFASGFEADYAIALGIGRGSFMYKLVQDATGTHLEVVRSSLNLVPTDSGNQPSYSFQFDWADIGLPYLNTNFFKFETSYITGTGSRSLQSFEGLIGQEGWDSITFTNYDTYGVRPVPENTNLALAVFGGIVATVALGKRARRRFAG
jgi:hypothetical protein